MESKIVHKALISLLVVNTSLLAVGIAGAIYLLIAADVGLVRVARCVLGV